MFNKNLTPNTRNSSVKQDNVFHKIFVQQKLNHWLGYTILALLSVAIGYLIAQKTLIGLGIVGSVCGLAIILICMLNTTAGLYINLIYAFFAFHISRLFFNDLLPVGVISDILILATLFSFFVKRISLRQRLNSFSQTPIVIVLIIVYCYTAIELFNPNAHSFNGWFQAFRKILGTLLMLFIAYNVFDNIVQVRKFITLLFILCTISALYGCVQQWHGLFEFELDWVTADAHRFGLLYIDGDFRKFSTMSDPTAFGIIMAVGSVFFIVIASGLKNNKRRFIILCSSALMLLSMSYSGTRTANAMMVGGLVLFILITLDQKMTQILAVISTIIFLGVMYGPFYNPTVTRFRSTFIGTQDDSYNVREKNRKRIQPYIYSHPIGGGLGTTGGNGVTYHPGHYLAGFPPDSGYLTKALELGWIGLIIFCVLNFTILKSGIHGYFLCKDEKFKIIYAACTSGIFCFYIGEFSQVALGQITDLVVYYPFVALVLKIKTFEQPNPQVNEI
ncbi:O-antigen ligase family protein [Flavitalea antarctica]